MKALVIAALLVACGDKYPVAQLEDPNTCKDCHGEHYDQWAGSMHAYASEDPVFVAMNQRGQREAQLGTFCVQCHAPMAVALNLTNGSDYNPATLPKEAKGITCYFCHNIDSVKADHNNGLVVALDQTMRGGVHDPKPSDTPAHESKFDGTLMSGYSTSNKSALCGSCHDIVTPSGVHLERSFEEWKTTIFASDDPTTKVACAACHMKATSDLIADNPDLTVNPRPYGFHVHTFPAIDQALTPFPDADGQAAGIKDILDPAIAIVGPRPTAGGPPPGGICLDPPGTLSVRMDTFSTGHMYPSGASQDRRVWLEVKAFDMNGMLVFSSGVVPPDMDPEEIHDPYVDCVDTAPFKCTGFWDRAFKGDNTPAHMFWDVARVESHPLKPPITLNPNDPMFDHSTSAKWDVTGVFASIDHITARIVTRSFNYTMLDDLVASGDLDSMYTRPTTTLKELVGAGAQRTWDKATKGTGSSMNTNCNPEQ